MQGNFPGNVFLLAVEWQVRRLAGGGAAAFGGWGAFGPPAAKPTGPGQSPGRLCARSAPAAPPRRPGAGPASGRKSGPGIRPGPLDACGEKKGSPSILGQVFDIAPATLVLLGLKEAELGMDLVVPLQHGAGLGVLDAIADGALQQGIHHDGVDA